MPVESMKSNELDFQVNTTSCKAQDCEGHLVFGLEVNYFEAGVENNFLIEDISTKKEDVQKLIILLDNNDVTLDQLSYIIEDYIQKLSM